MFAAVVHIREIFSVGSAVIRAARRQILLPARSWKKTAFVELTETTEFTSRWRHDWPSPFLVLDSSMWWTRKSVLGKIGGFLTEDAEIKTDVMRDNCFSWQGAGISISIGFSMTRIGRWLWPEKKSNLEGWKYWERQVCSARYWIQSTIHQRQLGFFGHVIRKHSLKHLVVTGKVEGKRGRGRRQKDWSF